MKRALLWVTIVIFGIMGSAIGNAVRAEDPEVGTSINAKKIAMNVGTTKMDTKMLEQKLDQILMNQQTILNRLEAMAEELRIIKIRATR